MSEITKYCKVKEAADTLGVDPATIVNMIKDGRLKGKKFNDSPNSHYFVERESLVQWTI